MRRRSPSLAHAAAVINAAATSVGLGMERVNKRNPTAVESAGESGAGESGFERSAGQGSGQASDQTSFLSSLAASARRSARRRCCAWETN